MTGLSWPEAFVAGICVVMAAMVLGLAILSGRKR